MAQFDVVISLTAKNAALPRLWELGPKALVSCSEHCVVFAHRAQSGCVSRDQAALLHERTIFGTDSSEAQRGKGR